MRRKRTAENLMSESRTMLKELRRLKKELLYNKGRGALRARPHPTRKCLRNFLLLKTKESFYKCNSRRD